MCNYYKPKHTLMLTVLFFTIDVCLSKSCLQTFCGRIRQSPEGFPKYSLDLKTLSPISDGIRGDLIGNDNLKVLEFQFHIYSANIFRVNIDEKKESLKRFRIEDVLSNKKYEKTLWKLEKQDNNTVVVRNENTTAIVYGKPFKIEFYANNKLLSVLNSKNRLVFETGKVNKSIAIDISFVEAHRAYGIPLHAVNLALQTTTINGNDPYRLYNLGHNEYEIKSTKALHGSVPVLYAHGLERSSGIFWCNSAQTWVDLINGPNHIDAFFMGESGAFDVFILTGPTLPDAVVQYTQLTDVAPLPQYFALGYHQSRLSYMSQTEALEVIERFDENSLPVDSVWLGNEYTDQNKDFTWDPIRFPRPIELENKLAATNRTLIVMIPPQIKVDQSYFVYNVSSTYNYFVRNPDGTDYTGNSLSGNSSWMDFSNPDTLRYYLYLHSLKTFKARNLHVWNSMNEPTVFGNPDCENTMSGDLLHYNNITHRAIHNKYGLDQTIGTFMGLIQRFKNIKDANRPFILTRSHFAGSQRFGAVWTGNNHASWEHLQISLPMCLTEALAGISFCGADVGGFNGIPEDELYLRWYQAGAWLPFYRGHSSNNVPRREPYLYPEKMRTRVRNALYQRYAHLPVWYTLFWEHRRNGVPVVRPVIYNYPEEEDALSIDNQICVGDNILAAPVLKPDVFQVSVYLPGGDSQTWYNIDNNYKALQGTGRHVLSIDLDSIPVFYKGGSIIPRKDIERQSAADTKDDPYTLYVCLNSNKEAKGTLYVDDYQTLNYATSSEYLYVGFDYANNNLSSYKIDKKADYKGAADVKQIVVLRPPKGLNKVKLVEKNKKDESEYELFYSADGKILTIDNLSLSLNTPFYVQFL